MSRKLLLASLGALALTGPVGLAADLGAPPPPPPYLPPPPLFTWTGIYVGGQVGYAWGAGNFNGSGFDPLTGAFVVNNLGSRPNGVIGGAHLGYHYQFNQFVLGVEGSVDGTSLSNTAVLALPVAFGGSTLTARSTADVQGSIRGKAGIAWDRVMIYGTGGVAFGGFNNHLTLIAPAFIPPFFATADIAHTRTGWTAGGGLEFAVTNNWWIYGEYRFSDFGTIRNGALSNVPAGVFFNSSRRLQENQVQGGFSYKFDTYAPLPVVSKY
jgi:outer membrane immunogenic protein